MLSRIMIIVNVIPCVSEMVRRCHYQWRMEHTMMGTTYAVERVSNNQIGRGVNIHTISTTTYWPLLPQR